MGDSQPTDEGFEPLDRRRGVRATSLELVAGLTRGVIAQGGEIWDGLRVVHTDESSRRVIVEGRTRLLMLRPGPATLYGVVDRGLVRMPTLVLEVDGTVATLHCDLARAELEARRSHDRIGIALAVRGEPLGGGDRWSGLTVNVSAGGALVDVDLDEGSLYRAAIGLPSADLVVGAIVTRHEGGGSVLQFTGLSDGARRALGLQLIRLAHG